MRSLLVAVLVLLAAPAHALATLDVYFQSEHYRGGMVHGLIRAENFEFVMGPNSCNAAVADCRSGPPTTLALERGGQIVETSAPSARPALASIPRAGDVVHVSVDGAERATAAYDGRPAFDDDCSPEGASVSGSLPPGASLEVRQADFVDGDGTAGSVTAAGDRFTATFPRRLRGAPVQVTANATVPRTDGGTAGVHVRHWTAISCQDGTGPQKTVHLAITGGKPLRAVHVDRRGRFVLARRTRCPQELPRCRVGVGVQAALPGGRSGKVLGGLAYTVRGGSNARVHGRLRPAALAGLRRKGARRVAFSVVIRPPKQMPKGIHATGLHAGYDGRLIAP